MGSHWKVLSWSRVRSDSGLCGIRWLLLLRRNWGVGKAVQEWRWGSREETIVAIQARDEGGLTKMVTVEVVRSDWILDIFWRERPQSFHLNWVWWVELNFDLYKISGISNYCVKFKILYSKVKSSEVSPYWCFLFLLTFVWKNIWLTLAQLDLNIGLHRDGYFYSEILRKRFLNTYILCSHLHDVTINRFETSAKLSSTKSFCNKFLKCVAD